METNSRRKRGARWWTIAAVLAGFAAPATAQSTLPPRPLPSATGAWPEFPQPASAASFGYGPADSGADSLPRLDPIKPAAKLPGTTTSTNLPSFAGFGAARSGQSISPSGALLQSQNSTWDRSPKDFGNGWKNFINQQITGMPAATLAAPRSASAGPRPDWNWNGYEAYNRGRAAAAGPPADTANAADLAPYMKYAHLWRPSGQPSMPTRPNTPASQNEPSVSTAGFSPVNDVNSKWNGYGATSNPNATAVAKPADPVFHAAPAEPRAPAPLPPLTSPAPLVSNVPATPANLVPAPTEGSNRLHFQVREKISQVCANRCRNLVVETISPIRLRIAFLVKDQTEADMLTNLLGSLPGLAPYKVDFEVQIGQ